MSRPRTRASKAPATYVLVYDAGCPFCTAVARRVQKCAVRPVALASYDGVECSGMLTELNAQEIRGAVHLITPDGFEYHGGEAVTRAARLLRFGRLAALLDLPGFTLARDVTYEGVARARPVLSRLIRPRD